MPKINYAAIVPVPANGAMNSGLSYCPQSLLINLIGVPGAKTKNCSPVTNPKLKKLLVTKNVGPFSVTGIKPAVASLERIFKKVKERDPDLHSAIKTAGMLCCRLIRGSSSTFSNHSWGTAIDLFCGSGVTPLGEPITHLGVMRLYPYFHNEGWYWGAGFKRHDAMHYEISAQLIKQWIDKGVLK